MTAEQQEHTLSRLFKRVNKRLFDNGLLELPIWIVDRVEVDEEECLAAYSPEKQRYFFSGVIAEDISSLSQEKQKKALACIMIHEMCHQYCYENGYDNGRYGDGHNEHWHAVANSHGLEGTYPEERLSLLGYLAIRTFRL